MPLIRQADRNELARDAIVLDLGDLAHQAERLKEAARAEADRIIQDAHAERERILAGAHEEGRAAGYAEGLEQGRMDGLVEGRAQACQESSQRLEALEQDWRKALEQFATGRDTLVRNAHHDVVQLALLIGRRVTRLALECDGTAAVAQVEAVLEQIAVSTRLTIEIHPDDETLVQEVMPDLAERLADGAHVELRTNAQLERGACIARLPTGGSIDAGISTQLDRIAAVLLGETEATTETTPRLTASDDSDEVRAA